MGERVNNMGKMLNNPKQRNIYFMVIGAVALTLGAGVYVATRDTSTQAAPASASVTEVPNVTTVPGGSTSVAYNDKVKENNAAQAQKALNGNGTFVATITSGAKGSDVSPIDLIDKQKAEEKKKKEEQEAKEIAELQKVQEEERQRLAQMQPVQPPTVITTAQVTPLPAAQAKPAAKPRYTADDYMLIASLMTTTKSKASSSEFDFSKGGGQNGGMSSNNAGYSNANNNVNYSADQNNQGVNKDTQAIPLVKAGTIVNAVLETAVNSDEPSPVLARVVSGPLKGTRLIGSVQTVGEKVVLQFSTANMPAYSSSIKISAVAVDPSTSRTALASDVDHHYFQKYGVLLGSAFLSGWAQAIQQNNQVTTVTPLGGIVTTPASGLSSRDINRQAIGNVGNELAQQTKQANQNLKPTITVNSGIAMGVLIMDDLIVGKQN